MSHNDPNLPAAMPPLPPGSGTLVHYQPAQLSTRVLQQQARNEDADQADDEIDLKAIFRTLWKHKTLIAGVAGLCVLAAGLYTLRVKPQYQSSVMLQIDRAAQKVVGFNNDVEVDEGPAADQLQLRTQIELLKSRSLAERVIDEIGLYKPSTLAPKPGEDTGAGDAANATGAFPGSNTDAAAADE